MNSQANLKSTVLQMLQVKEKEGAQDWGIEHAHPRIIGSAWEVFQEIDRLRHEVAELILSSLNKKYIYHELSDEDILVLHQLMSVDVVSETIMQTVRSFVNDFEIGDAIVAAWRGIDDIPRSIARDETTP